MTAPGASRRAPRVPPAEFADTVQLPRPEAGAADAAALRGEAANDEDSPLFRAEVLEGRRPQMAGEVLLSARPSAGWAALLAGLAALALLGLLLGGSYTRRATVAGYLAPDQGVLRLHAPGPATVLEQHVREGQDVQRDQVLYVLGTDRPAAGEAGYQAGIRDSLEERRRLLEAERQTVAAATDEEVAALGQRLAVTRRAALQAEGQQRDLRAERDLAAQAAARYRGLFEQGLVTRDTWQAREREVLDLGQREAQLGRERLVLQREAVEIGQALEAARSRLATQQQALGRELAAVREQYSNVEARRRIVVTAPQAGRATLVQGLPGSSVDASRPLLTLLPREVTLQALLYAPSRTVGFVRPGTPVWLRHEAYPFQKFGHQRGEVVSVSTFPAEAGELAGLAAFAQAAGSEPLYAITVRLDRQTLAVGAQAQPLRPGLRVEADLLMENRRLYEWMLEPLFSLRRVVGA